MDWNEMKTQLESALGLPIEWDMLSREEWEQWSAEHSTASGEKCLSYQSRLYFPVYDDFLHIHLLVIDEDQITERERALIELFLSCHEASHCAQTVGDSLDEEEKKAMLLRNWCNRQLDMGITQAELPDSLVSQLSLFSTKIPILLAVDHAQSQNVSYVDLRRLLESFFEAEVVLIPLLDNEWLILGSESLLTASHSEEREDEEETLEESLSSICFGLQEMLTSEWVGDCQISIYYPIAPAGQLLRAVCILRETMQLGRSFHVGRNIHLPWRMQLEKLLHVVPNADKLVFLEQTLGAIDHLLDPETMMTLDTFFQLDCNVSETAKKLYIHRNTLLYRLEKFRQETGLDVKAFHDAVLVKLALLLYKITKRK